MNKTYDVTGQQSLSYARKHLSAKDMKIIWNPMLPAKQEHRHSIPCHGHAIHVSKAGTHLQVFRPA